MLLVFLMHHVQFAVTQATLLPLDFFKHHSAVFFLEENVKQKRNDTGLESC